jgi:hypothetical protein
MRRCPSAAVSNGHSGALAGQQAEVLGAAARSRLAAVSGAVGTNRTSSPDTVPSWSQGCTTPGRIHTTVLAASGRSEKSIDTRPRPRRTTASTWKSPRWVEPLSRWRSLENDIVSTGDASRGG